MQKILMAQDKFTTALEIMEFVSRWNSREFVFSDQKMVAI